MSAATRQGSFLPTLASDNRDDTSKSDLITGTHHDGASPVRTRVDRASRGTEVEFLALDRGERQAGILLKSRRVDRVLDLGGAVTRQATRLGLRL